jgi:hypothetical protein
MPFLLLGQDLKWDNTSFTYKAELADKGVDFSYKLKNNSASDVVISKGKSSCACMTLKTKFPLTVKAGSEVMIEAYYDFTGKVGLNRGTIYVHLPSKKIELGVEVDIPVAVQVSPRFLIWKKGDRASKKIQISIHADYKGSIDKVACVDDKSDIAVVMVKQAKSYTVTVSPGASVSKKRTWVIVTGKDAAGVSQEYRIYMIFN